MNFNILKIIFIFAAAFKQNYFMMKTDDKLLTSDKLKSSIESMIIVIRGQQVILDRDLAMLYGVETKRLKEQVNRNVKRFPPDFMFRLDQEELVCLRSQIATSNKGVVLDMPLTLLLKTVWPCSAVFCILKKQSQQTFKLCELLLQCDMFCLLTYRSDKD